MPLRRGDGGMAGLRGPGVGREERHQHGEPGRQRLVGGHSGEGTGVVRVGGPEGEE